MFQTTNQKQLIDDEQIFKGSSSTQNDQHVGRIMKQPIIPQLDFWTGGWSIPETTNQIPIPAKVHAGGGVESRILTKKSWEQQRHWGQPLPQCGIHDGSICSI